MKMLIVYDSRTGNTEKMAFAVAEGVKSTGVEAVLKNVDDATVDEIPAYDGFIIGSPVYYGLPTAKIKAFIDASVKHHGKLDGMVGGAFASAGGSHTGAETTIISLLESLMIHGMVVQGTSSTNHYGAASVGAPDDKAVEVCRKMGERLGNLAKKLHE